MNDLYILVEDDSTYNFMIDTMFSDAINAYNMQVCVEKKSNNLMINLLKNRKFKRITKGCFDSLLEKRYILRKQILDISNSYNQVYFIFLNSSFLESRYPASVLKKYKAISNKFIFVLLYIDIISHPCSRHANYLRSTGIFDYIYTVDKNDARLYNLRFWPTPYSKCNNLENISIKYDIYFCAVTKDRLPIISQVLNAARKNNIMCQMDIIKTPLDPDVILKGFDSEVNIYPPDIYMKYDDILRNTLCANCILEIVQENQAALTLRAYEAVVYNRKLLTNNRSIMDFPFWNPKYMQFFEKVENINWKWVKENVAVNYNYDDRYSPNKFLEDIEKRTERK